MDIKTLVKKPQTIKGWAILAGVALVVVVVLTLIFANRILGWRANTAEHNVQVTEFNEHKIQVEQQIIEDLAPMDKKKKAAAGASMWGQ